MIRPLVVLLSALVALGLALALCGCAAQAQNGSLNGRYIFRSEGTDRAGHHFFEAGEMIFSPDGTAVLHSTANDGIGGVGAINSHWTYQFTDGRGSACSDGCGDRADLYGNADGTVIYMISTDPAFPWLAEFHR